MSIRGLLVDSIQKGLNQIPNWLSSNPDLFANSDIILRLLSTHNFEEVHLQIT